MAMFVSNGWTWSIGIRTPPTRPSTTSAGRPPVPDSPERWATLSRMSFAIFAVDNGWSGGLDGLGQQIDVGPPRRVEAALQGVDAVLPDPDVHGLLLGGDVRAQLRTAPVGEQLDPERRARRHRRQHGPDDDRDVAPLEA